MKRLGWRERPENIYQLQAAAAVGQMGLVQTYESLFAKPCSTSDLFKFFIIHMYFINQYGIRILAWVGVIYTASLIVPIYAKVSNIVYT
jgi:hypothetical protein